MDEPSELILSIAVIAGSGMIAQWLAWRLRWPSIVLMMAAGLLLGPLAEITMGTRLLDPPGVFGDYLRPLMALAVAIILFEGGITLNVRELRDASGPVRRIVLLGFPIGWGLTTLALHYLAGLAWDLAAMIGALLTTTGPTVVMPLLNQARLPARISSVLKWEGIVNDPIGALSAVIMFEIVRQTALGQSVAGALGQIAIGAIIGAALGFILGWAMARAFRAGLVPENMKAPALLALVLVCFALAETLAAETGLVAVTFLGLVIANARLAAIEDVRRFKEGIASLLVASVFVVLAAGLPLDDLARLNWQHAVFILVFMLVVRPLGVILATAGSGLERRETAFIGLIGPRGVVAAAAAGHLASILVDAGRADAGILAPLVFAIIFASVVGCGFAVAPLARALGLSVDEPERVLLVDANPWSLGFADALKNAGVPITLADDNWYHLRPARLAGHDVFYGEVLSERGRWTLQPSRFACLLAAGPMPAYNALVCLEYAPELGRSRVFQLSSQGETQNGDAAEESRGIVYTARGRTLIHRGRDYDSLIRDWWQGWRFRVTGLTEAYTLEDAQAEPGDIIAACMPDGRLVLIGANKDAPDGEGVKLIRFVPPDEIATA